MSRAAAHRPQPSGRPRKRPHRSAAWRVETKPSVIFSPQAGDGAECVPVTCGALGLIHPLRKEVSCCFSPDPLVWLYCSCTRERLSSPRFRSLQGPVSQRWRKCSVLVSLMHFRITNVRPGLYVYKSFSDVYPYFFISAAI